MLEAHNNVRYMKWHILKQYLCNLQPLFCGSMFGHVPGTGNSLVFMEAGAKRSDPLTRIEASSVVEIGRVAVFNQMIASVCTHYLVVNGCSELWLS